MQWLCPPRVRPNQNDAAGHLPTGIRHAGTDELRAASAAVGGVHGRMRALLDTPECVDNALLRSPLLHCLAHCHPCQQDPHEGLWFWLPGTGQRAWPEHDWRRRDDIGAARLRKHGQRECRRPQDPSAARRRVRLGPRAWPVPVPLPDCRLHSDAEGLQPCVYGRLPVRPWSRVPFAQSDRVRRWPLHLHRGRFRRRGENRRRRHPLHGSR